MDWYWYSGVKIMEEALERGLLQARNRERIRFALMWANHNWEDYFPPPFGQKWNSWLPSRHTLNDWNRVIDVCIEQISACRITGGSKRDCSSACSSRSTWCAIWAGRRHFWLSRL